MAQTDTEQRRPGSRRVRIHRNEAVLVALIAGAAGVGAMMADLHPTPLRAANAVWAVAVTGAVVWASATTRWWILGVAGLVATPLSSDPWPIGCAVAGFLAAMYVGSGQRRMPVMRAASAALIAQALLRLHLHAFHGDSALLVGVFAVTASIAGLTRRSRLVRHRARRAMLLTGGVMVLGAVGAVAAGLLARSSLTDSRTTLRQALSALRSGDFDRASTLIGESRTDLHDAATSLRRPWGWLARVVPIVGQQIDALGRLSVAGEHLGTTAASSLASINLDSLSVRNGVIDLDAVTALSSPLERTYHGLVELQHAMAEASDPWLIGPLASRLRPVAREVDGLVRQTKIGLDTVAVAPSMLGRDGPRTYFVAFTTPAEARGLGGYMASWAELHVDHGSIRVARTGSTIDLLGGAPRRTLQMPPEYVSRYGPFGAGNGQTPVAIDFWSNVTMPPDLPTIADVVAQLYPVSGGTRIDGVIALDVPTIARFMKLTGPLTVPGLDGQLTADNLTQYLLYDQYERFRDDGQRDAVQAELTKQLLSAVFDGSLPGIRVVAEAVGPAIAQRRLTVWSLHPDDQALLSAIGVDGALPRADASADGFAVVVNNAGGNKLDAYLRRTVEYRATLDSANRRLSADLDVTLNNTVQHPESLSTYAVGNQRGLPVGTNRMYLSIYTRFPVDAATVDGQPAAVQTQSEHGWVVTSMYLDVPPDSRRTVHLHVGGQLARPADYDVVAIPQPSAQPDTVSIRITTPSGALRAQRVGLFDALERVTLRG